MTNRTGTVLLEVMLALGILAIAGGALLALTSENSRALAGAGASDERIQRADDFMAVVSLWNAEDLDRRLGVRRQGPWLLTIQRSRPALYDVVLMDSASRPVLATALFRPAAP